MVVALVGLWSGLALASDVEEPRWQLLGKVGGVELRYYEPTIEARTTLGSNSETSAGFQRLAGFIFGGNSNGQKIAMTAPVQETLVEDQPVMSFTMPSAYSLEDLPAPDDERVSLTEVPGRTLAVVSFSGWATAAKIEKNTEALLRTLEEYSIEVVSAPSLNQYNPPWTLPFMRRNEIVVEVSGPLSADVVTQQGS
jgi:effector-binding domain-containing protein